jgi:hypothetical protein
LPLSPYFDSQIASNLTYDGNSHQLTLHRDDGTEQSYPANNNVDSHSQGHWPNGTYDYDQHVTHTGDGPDSAYGSNGGYQFDVPDRTGMEVHSGRENVPDGRGRTGADHATMGCIRTNDAGTAAIGNAAQEGDPVTSITVQNNPQ